MWSCFFINFIYWSKFHANIITGSWVMIIFFCKGLARNPEIGNTPVRVLPSKLRLGQIRGAKIGKNVSNKMLLNSENCQGYTFYFFRVIKGKPPPTQINRILFLVRITLCSKCSSVQQYESKYSRMDQVKFVENRI